MSARSESTVKNSTLRGSVGRVGFGGAGAGADATAGAALGVDADAVTVADAVGAAPWLLQPSPLFAKTPQSTASRARMRALLVDFELSSNTATC